MKRNLIAVVLGGFFVLATAAGVLSAGAPTPVSPGGSAESPDVSTPCPTFSWGAVEGAKAYELAVFEQAGEYLAYADNLAISGNSVLKKIIPAPALAWTPGAGHCLRPDNTYTWYVRSVDVEGQGIWSAGQAFEVASRFSGEQFDAAVASAIERYIAGRKATDISSFAGKARPAVTWETEPSALQKQGDQTGANVTANVISPAAFIPLDGYEGEGTVYGNYNNTGDFGYVGGLRASVYGKHSAETVGSGVRGFGAGTYANGVTGETAGAEASGVRGSSTGSTGTGVSGSASNAGDYLNYGGWFKAWGKKGIGVYGEGVAAGLAVPGGNLSDPASHLINYGGYFKAHGSAARGVYAEVDTGETGLHCDGESLNQPSMCTSYAGMFVGGTDGIGIYATGYYGGIVAYSSNRTAVIGYSDAPGFLGGVEGFGTYGVKGNGSLMDFYASGPGSNYGPFTGSHEVRLSTDTKVVIVPGMLTSTTGNTAKRLTDNGEVSLSSTLPTVRISDTPNDPAVFGALVKETQSPGGDWYTAKPGDRFGIVNALGEGRLWVSDANGPISAGDLITTSSLPGYGQKQDDDVLHSYTAAKATETVDWDTVTETVEHNGRTHKVYLVGVVYTSG
ncbi:MAG: hypothetical protein C0402_11600 [Thermodesulfovibrio sp.]|nr:hypothetical protein [Thermodesulfovibrio sp.]